MAREHAAEPEKAAEPAPVARPATPGHRKVASVLALQRSAGNAAVARAIAGQAAGGRDAGQAGGRGAAQPAGGADRARLKREIPRLRRAIADAKAAHAAAARQHGKDWTSKVGNAVGFAKAPPPLTIWAQPEGLLRLAAEHEAAGRVGAAQSAMQQAAAAAAASCRNVAAYQQSVATGADWAVTGLDVLVIAGSIAAGIASAGAAPAGAGVLTAATFAGRGAFAYGLAQDMGTQGGEMVAGTRAAGSFDYVQALLKGGGDAVSAFVGGLAGGALSKFAMPAFAKHGLARATKAEKEAIAKAIGVEVKALTPKAFETEGRRLVTDFMGNVAAAPLSISTQIVIEWARDQKEPPTTEEFAKRVIQNAVEGGLVPFFVGWVVTRGKARPQARTEQHAAPPQPPTPHVAPPQPRAPHPAVPQPVLKPRAPTADPWWTPMVDYDPHTGQISSPNRAAKPGQGAGQARRVTGKDFESAPVLGPTIGAHIPGYRGGRPITTLLGPNVHAAVDAAFVPKWRGAVTTAGKGGPPVVARNVFEMYAEATHKVPPTLLPSKTAGTLVWRLHKELFEELKLRPDTVIVPSGSH